MPINSWRVLSRSDFEIEVALDAARAQLPGVDLQRLAQLGGMQTVLAKRHYYQTGNLRWFQCDLVDPDQLEVLTPLGTDAAGRLILVIPTDEGNDEANLRYCAEASRRLSGGELLAIGLSAAGWRIRELGLELLAMEALQVGRPELSGDSVARREIAARLQALESEVEQQMRAAFEGAIWHVAGIAVPLEQDYTLTRLASDLADQCFFDAPHIKSELVNRQRPSSNTQAGVRDLLHAMVQGADRACLGIEGFPIERGLYSTVLASAGLHREVDGRYRFVPPDDGATGKTYQAMWRAAEELLAANASTVPLAAIYQLWAAPPFGMRRGAMPILATAFALANAERLAVYSEGQFQADIDTYFSDVLLQGEAHVALRWIVVDERQAAQVAAMARAAGGVGSNGGSELEPLEIARALVRRVREMPQWTRKTGRLSAMARELRRLLLQAHDPHKLLFTDLPAIFPQDDLTAFSSELQAALTELEGAYEAMLSQISAQLLRVLHHTAELPLDALNERAQAIHNRTGDFRVDAFAGRLAIFRGKLAEIEAIASLAISRPPRDWSDRDIDEATLALTDFAIKFCRAETLIRVQGREGKREAMALIIGSGGQGRAVVREFEIQDVDRPQVVRLAKELAGFLAQRTEDRNVMLAALAEAGALADTGSAPDPILPR